MEKEKREPVPEQEVDEGSEQSRREFITKLVTTAGAVAAVGLVAGAAEDDAKAAAFIKFDKLEAGGASVFKFHKDTAGFKISMSGRQLGDAMRQAGLLQEGANPENAKITIEFSS